MTLPGERGRGREDARGLPGASGTSPATPPAGGPSRVAVLSLHTSPTDQPGTGDSGGMNVYVLSVARRLARQGVAVDIFTRCAGRGVPEVEEFVPGVRLIQVPAGPCAPLPKHDLPAVLPAFLGGVLRRAADLAGLPGDPRGPHAHPPYDVVHSHYWLSGWVGHRAKEIWGVPHVASFHTLGKVKNVARSEADPPEPPVRLAGEQRVARAADRILAPTPWEAGELVALYGADPGRIRIVPPGVDRAVFAPRPREQALARLGLAGRDLVLFVGRLQPFKGPDVAVRALALAVARDPEATREVLLGVVGGPAGSPAAPDAVARLRRLAAALGVSERVRFYPPQPHPDLAHFYSAARAVVVPSRSESFGLVALEAQACGAPVIAAAAGGLRYAVRDGESGFLVPDHRPEAYAERILAVLRDPALAARLSRAAVRHAARFSWDATARDVHRVYLEVTAGGPR